MYRHHRHLGFTPITAILLLSLTSIYFMLIKIHLQDYIFQDLNKDKKTIVMFDNFVNSTANNYAINTPGCKIPDVNPHASIFSEILTNIEIPFCMDFKDLITITNGNIIEVNFTVLNKEYNGYFKYCLYTPIFRSDNGKTDNKFKFGGSVRFYRSIEVQHEFIKIECYNQFKSIYLNFYPFVLSKPNVESRCQHVLKKQHSTQFDRYSVMFIGIDSVSRLNFLRFCPLTHKYLTQEMEAIELRGYNKVGDNTFNNLAPLLLGQFVKELKLNKYSTFDKYPIIWKEFAQVGYRTMFAEDDTSSAIFNFDKNGFFNSPSDYYLRPFYLAFSSSDMFNYYYYECLGNRLNTKVILDYSYDFAKKFKSDLYFSFSFMSTLTHDEMTQVKSADIYLEDFFKKLTGNKLLDNTILFFISDHGMRFGKFRESYFGKLEERLPLLYIYLPEKFRTKYPLILKAVKENSKRLTTPFDIYATLKDIQDFKGKSNKKQISKHHKGLSLFEVIPEERSCDDAFILPHWCTCQEKHQLPTDDDVILLTAAYLIDTINNITESSRHICARRTIRSVIDAWYNSANKQLLSYVKVKGDGINEDVKYGKESKAINDITLTIESNPHNAKFEATVRYDINTGIKEMMGDISRIDRYGEQSHCVKDANLKKYCYCNDIL